MNQLSSEEILESESYLLNNTFVGNRFRTGFVDAKGNEARFSSINDMKFNSINELIVCDSGNHAIRKVTPDGIVTTIAGNGRAGFENGQEKNASFNFPMAIDIDNQNNIYVADTGNHAIRKITPEGIVSTIYKAKK